VIWHPLLKVKFGDCHDQISAAWIWHRIWRVATSRRSMLEREVFGCLEHSNPGGPARRLAGRPQRGLWPLHLSTTEPRYRAADQDLFAEYTAMLKLMNPDFSESWVKEYHVFRTPHAAGLHHQLLRPHARAPDSDPGSLRHGLHPVLPGRPHDQPGDPPGPDSGGHEYCRFDASTGDAFMSPGAAS
jgi:hypothetical protein